MNEANKHETNQHLKSSKPCGLVERIVLWKQAFQRALIKCCTYDVEVYA